MSHRLPRVMKAAALAGFAALLSASAWSQARTTGASPALDSRLDIYGGYGWWKPTGDGVGGHKYAELYNPNATLSVALYFTRHLGVQAEGSYFSEGRTIDAFGNCNENPCLPVGERLYTGEIGPIARFTVGRFRPFVHALGGGEKLSGPQYNRLTLGWGVTGGAGVDYIVPWLNGRLAIRPIQADFQYQQVSYGPLQLPASNVGGFASFPSLKLSGGVVLRLGGHDMDTRPHGEPMLGCDASPSSIYAGDPVTVIASPQNFKEGKLKTYRWLTSGGVLTSGDDGATITTAGLAPGDYKVSGLLTQGNTTAKCESSFTVKEVEPPTLSCSADPATVQAGGVATITAMGSSAANRALTYSFTTDGGLITGTGNKVQLASAGVTAQAINVVCNVVDDQGRTAQAGTMVSLLQTSAPSAVQAAAMAPPLAQSQALCGVGFDRDKRRPVRVDNEAKACLDDIALTLQRQTDAKLAIVGNFGAGETASQGAERSLNVRQYLTDAKGIDPTRIEVRYGTASGRSVDDILLPAGVTYDNDKTTAFDPTSVKRVGQAYGKPGHHATGRGHRVRHGHRRHRHHAAAGAPVTAPTAQ